MKKICIAFLTLAISLTMFGCRKKTEPTPTESTTTPTQGTTIPSNTETNPIIETNIPDPTVESNSDNTDNTLSDGNTGTDSTETTNNSMENSRTRMFR